MIYKPAIDTQVPVQARPVFHSTEQMRDIMSRLDEMEDRLETLRTTKDSYRGRIYRVPFTPESRALCMEIEALEKQWNDLARQNNPEYYQFWESYWESWSCHKREYRDAYAAKLWSAKQKAEEGSKNAAQ